MKIDIKQKIRLNLPETNSSSSHSLVIGYNNNYLKSRMDALKELEPYLNDNGILIVNSAEFGWESGKSNNIYEKLQYLMAISCSYHGCGWEDETINNRAKVQKFLSKVEKIVRDYTGITEVKFETKGSGVDHQSIYLYDDIAESTRSIKNFLFSNQSWVFLGNDNSGDELGEMEMRDETYYGLLTVHIPGKFGNIECPLIEPVDSKYSVEPEAILDLSPDAKSILKGIVLTKNSDGDINCDCRSDLMDDVGFIVSSTITNPVPGEYYFTEKFVEKDGEWFLLWALPDIMSGYRLLPNSISDEERKNYFKYDNLPKDKIILVEVDLVLEEYGQLNLFKKK